MIKEAYESGQQYALEKLAEGKAGLLKNLAIYGGLPIAGTSIGVGVMQGNQLKEEQEYMRDVMGQKAPDTFAARNPMISGALSFGALPSQERSNIRETPEFQKLQRAMEAQQIMNEYLGQGMDVSLGPQISDILRRQEDYRQRNQQ